MSIESGTNLGPYRIMEPLGAGGMGEVYRAHDTRLDRSVAIKVLPGHLSGDSELKSRFEREARTISSLNHPHICALFDIGSEDGVDFLVMEYIDGTTLADRFEKGDIAPDEMLRIAIQMADALGAAHRGGVVHRDLKPGNVMLTRAGVKLLDFGLAKMVESGQEGNAPASALTQLATQHGASHPITQKGTIVGTFQYMSPEQLEGREADARSDIFALGAILYEMATGKRAFEAGSQASLIAAILERTPPPLSAVRPMSPPALDNLVQACLAKDPDDRVQTAHDVALQLRWIAEGGSRAGVPAPVVAQRRRTSRLAWISTVVLAVATLVLAIQLGSRPAPRRSRVIASIQAPEASRFFSLFGGHLALSPDGSKLAFTAFTDDGNAYLWVRDLAEPEAVVLKGTANAIFPFWSPDSRYIGYFITGKLRRVPATGGPMITVADAPQGRGASWGADGTIVYAPGSGGGLLSVSESGGTPAEVTRPDSAQAGISHRWPWFLPDGEHFLFVSQSARGTDLMLGSLTGDAPRRLLSTGSNAAYANGHLIYERDGTLLAHPFDVSTLNLTGDPIPIADPVAQNLRFGKADFSVSSNDILVYSQGGEGVGSMLTTYDRDGRQLGVLESATAIDDLARSPDGKHLSFMRVNLEENDADVWTYDLVRGVFSRLTFTGAADDPAWSPDGRWIAYASRGDLYRKLASGAGEPQLIFASPDDKVTHDWSSDGKHLIFSVVDADNFEDLWVAELGSATAPGDTLGEGRSLLATPYRDTHGQLSPDGRWLAYTSDASGSHEVYVQSFPDLEGKWQISVDGGSMPRWRGDGREIFFVALDRTMMSAEVASDGGSFSVGKVQPLFQTQMHQSVTIRTHQYTVSPDGNVFVVLDRPPLADRTGKHATLMMHWAASLSSR